MFSNNLGHAMDEDMFPSFNGSIEAEKDPL